MILLAQKGEKTITAIILKIHRVAAAQLDTPVLVDTLTLFTVVYKPGLFLFNSFPSIYKPGASMSQRVYVTKLNNVYLCRADFNQFWTNYPSDTDL